LTVSPLPPARPARILSALFIWKLNPRNLDGPGERHPAGIVVPKPNCRNSWGHAIMGESRLVFPANRQVELVSPLSYCPRDHGSKSKDIELETAVSRDTWLGIVSLPMGSTCHGAVMSRTVVPLLTPWSHVTEIVAKQQEEDVVMEGPKALLCTRPFWVVFRSQDCGTAAPCQLPNITTMLWSTLTP